MRTIKILFFLLPALLQLTDAGAVVTGDLINRDGITYVVTLKRDAGNGHPAAYHVAFVGSDLAEVKIPETVKDSANEHTWTVTALADNSKVKNATSVTIPNTVETLNAQCLQGSLLTTVNIPASATDIKDGVFAFTLGLQRITVDAANPTYYARDGVLYSRDGGGYLVAYPVARAGAAFSIPEGIVGIRPNALQQNRNLETIRLPKSLTELPAAKEYNGFTSALKLSAIEVDPANPKFSGVGGVILSKDGEQLVVYPNAKKGDPYTVPATVKQILDGAFGHAEGLKGIVMTPPLVKIGKESFKDCIQLLTVTIPSTVTKIDDGAFSGAYRVKGFVVDPSNTVYKTDDKGVIYSADGTELAAFPAGMTGTYATLPTTKRILKEAFKAAPAVEKVIFNSGLETIGQDAFQAATGLKRIEFAAPATVRGIGDFSFYGSALETLRLPASVETVGLRQLSPAEDRVRGSAFPPAEDRYFVLRELRQPGVVRLRGGVCLEDSGKPYVHERPQTDRVQIPFQGGGNRDGRLQRLQGPGVRDVPGRCRHPEDRKGGFPECPLPSVHHASRLRGVH